MIHSYFRKANNKKLAHNEFVGELEVGLLHLAHTLHHHYHFDRLLEVAEGEKQI